MLLSTTVSDEFYAHSGYGLHFAELPFAHILSSRAYVKLAYSWSMGPDPENPVSAPLQDFQKDLAINM